MGRVCPPTPRLQTSSHLMGVVAEKTMGVSAIHTDDTVAGITHISPTTTPRTAIPLCDKAGVILVRPPARWVVLVIRIITPQISL